MTTALLRLDELSVGFLPMSSAVEGQGQRPVTVLRNVSFSLRRGECVGLVGESGSGKTLTALSILGLLPPGARLLSGGIHLDGEGDLQALEEVSLQRRVRGCRVAMVFQDPATALNPLHTVGFHLREVLRHQRRLRGREATRESLRLLDLVALPQAAQRLGSYPHQLSGGQRQRVLLAMALAAGPELLLADEPTTALDVTVQAQILDLLDGLRRELNLTVLLITHDLGVVAGLCERVLVMYAGEVVEDGPVQQLFDRPQHPYTQALLAALPRLGDASHAVGLPGRPPQAGERPQGCAFHPRCQEAETRCRATEPALLAVAEAHLCRCLLRSRAGNMPGAGGTELDAEVEGP